MTEKKATTRKATARKVAVGTVRKPMPIEQVRGLIVADGEHLFVLDEVRRGEFVLRMYQRGGAK